ncbi:ankyrin repeat domain-containing protein [Segetibacter sp. 3557_3]|uniref:ankyrin repeat domain-containing protein n=1 Tax=Segetibacter sp. 3557_3 TaxID=2547429 RepID=UPI00105906D2|nr:ankyrin repeat domain-containing protein [Segetibacter sp. 3557_3]TDH21585.1 ankyrin repeat domain-containing protein [Segetibacter sp. 3557_3]
MDMLQQLLVDIELHSVEGLRHCFVNGVDPNESYNNHPLVFELVSEYTRSPRFKECMKVFVDYGLRLDDPALLAVLLDDEQMLEKSLSTNPAAIYNTYDLRCAYTPLLEASLLHIAAEYNHLSCAKLLVQEGVNVNVRAGVDQYGFGGQTPIFHTVNQNGNQSKDVMEFLIAQGANLEITVKGLIWGEGYEWETLIAAVNPISYAMMGLLPQMHRSEVVIAGVVSTLLKAAYQLDYTSKNVPCAYLRR